MAGLCSTRGVGQYVASEAHRGFYGRLSKATDKGVVWLTGSHSLADSIATDTSVTPVVQALADARFRMLCGDIGQTTTQGTFGNATVVTRAGQLKTFLQGTVKAASGKVHIWGASGGAAGAINFARANPTLVASMYLCVPLTALEAFYDSTPIAGITAAEMRTAYGAADDAAFRALMPANDPSASGNQAALAGIPMTLAYASDDPYIPVSTVTNYAALVNAAGGSATLVNQGAVGHSGAGVIGADVASFFQAHP